MARMRHLDPRRGLLVAITTVVWTLGVWSFFVGDWETASAMRQVVLILAVSGLVILRSLSIAPPQRRRFTGGSNLHPLIIDRRKVRPGNGDPRVIMAVDPDGHKVTREEWEKRRAGRDVLDDWFDEAVADTDQLIARIDEELS